MNCVLTSRQQELLVKKVAADLDALSKLDFKSYARDFYNQVVGKTNDPALGVNYVAMLPTTIWAVMGVNKPIRQKISGVAGNIAAMEQRFEDITKAEEFVNGFISEQATLPNIEKTIQKDSLVAPREAPDPLPSSTPITPNLQGSIFDMALDVNEFNFLNPEMKVYADAKAELIRKKRPDGTSEINGTPVKIVLMSTKDFETRDFYPDTQRDIQAGVPDIEERIKEGVVLVVTNPDGSPVRFNNDLTKAEDGKLIFYNIRSPKVTSKLKGIRSQDDQKFIMQLMKDRKVSQKEAEAILDKQLDLISNLREAIRKNPSLRINMKIKGGEVRISAKTSKVPTLISRIDFSSHAFQPYPGIPAQGQKSNVYYFNYPGTTFPITINRPGVPPELVEKLAQLMSEEVNVKQGSKLFKLDAGKKIQLFNQFVYIPAEIMSFSVDKGGNLVVSKMGQVVSYEKKEDIARDITEFLTGVVRQRKLSTEEAQRLFAKGYRRVTPVNIKLAQPGQILEEPLPDGSLGYYVMGPFQMSVNKTFVGKNYNDFELTPTEAGLVLRETPKLYDEFIKNNFLIGYDTPQVAGSTLDLEVDSGAMVQATSQFKRGRGFSEERRLSQEERDRVKESILGRKPIEKTIYKGVPVVEATITNNQGQKGGAQYSRKEDIIKIDREVLKQKFEQKAWSKPRIEGVRPFSKNEFETYDEWERFVIEHEYQHKLNPRLEGESLAEYENRINELAIGELDLPTLSKESVEKKLTAKEKLLRKNGLFKLMTQSQLKATEKQIEEAEKWYNNNPLSKYFPFETLFDMVNKEDSNAIAKWTISGITLYKGANYSDLYHEAWHGFTQGFLTREEKRDLYKDVRKKSGSFVDYSGKLVKFKDATDLQVEEFLAEDFREYMISDGKSVLKGSVKRNTIFRRILNFLKQLFGSASVVEGVIDEQVLRNVSELYKKLRVGDLSPWTFSVENRNFDTLNKALQPINNEDEVLSFENSNLLYQSVTSLFSEAIDVLNAGNINKIKRRDTLQKKSNLTQEERVELQRLNVPITSSYTGMLSSVEGVKQLYEYVKDSMEDRLATLQESNDKNPSTYFQKKIDLLSYALRNFGDVEDLYLNEPDAGVIGYHLYKSELIEDNVFKELYKFKSQEEQLREEEELLGRESEGKAFFDRGGNERSIFDLANKEIRVIISTLNKTYFDSTVIENQLGFPEPVAFKEAFAYIARIVQNSKDRMEMFERLQAEAETYPPIQQLLNKMGPLSYKGQSDREVDIWNKFYQTFNKYRIVLNQLTINEEFETDDDGNKVTKSTYDIRIGNALADYKRVDQDWRNAFAKETENPFIKNDVKGNYLDLNGLFDEYPTLKDAEENALQFLNDVGIKLKQINVIRNELDKALSSGDIRLSGIYSNLVKLNKANVTVRGLSAFLNHNSKWGIVGQTGLNSNYGKILLLQNKYSGDYSDFMVRNAAGDPQSEFSQNNTLTQKVKKLNAVRSFNELVNTPVTAEFNNEKNIAGRPYNPFVNSSIWLSSLFDMESLGGPKRKNEFVIDNLSGLNSSVNDGVFESGVALAESDEIGKLLHDFHMILMKYSPELTRHAGKKTSLSVYLRKYNTGARNQRLYIDSENFIPEPNGFNQGLSDFYNITIKYLAAELDRVNYAKTLQRKNSGVGEYDFSYLERATKFSAFAGVLSEATKNKLYGITTPLLEYLESEEGVALSDTIYDEISAYLGNLVNEVDRKMTVYNFISPTLLENTKKAAGTAGKSLDEGLIRKGLIYSFVANNWIHHFEEMIVLYGDIALYKDFFKRNAALNSTGDVLPTDQLFVNYVNDVLGRPFAKQLGAQETYDGRFNTAVVSDVIVKSAYLDEYKKASPTKSTEEKYDKVNEADAQGLITFDTYRIILKGLGKWTLSQEDVFQKILAGESIDKIEIREFFPVLKMGYYGPLQTEGLPLTALHKFSLFPLIPGVIPENLTELHGKMMREGIDYLTFESGSKVATVSSRSGIQPLYEDSAARKLSTAPFVKNTIFADYLKYQLESPNRYKGKVTFMTQLRKLADLGVMNNGVPVDYNGSKESWKALSESAKVKASKGYGLRKNYIKSLYDLQQAQIDILLREVDWKKDKDGNYSGSMDKMLGLISNELKRSDVGEHEWNYIQTIKGHDIKNSLDISQSADVIEKVITALVNKRLIRTKVNGEQLVLVSTTGFENKSFAYGPERSFDKPTAEDIVKYGSNDLPFYQLKDGKIAAAKVKIALQGDFKKLLVDSDVKARAKEQGISAREALNQLLKEDTWLDKGQNRKMVTMVGARIPTQGLNSSEFLEVYEFLPEVAGNIIITPTEMTAKSGTDFDYDKLPLMMPNLRVIEGQPVLAKKYTKEEAQRIYQKVIDKAVEMDRLKTTYGTVRWKEDAAVDKLLVGIFGQGWDAEYTEEEINDILKDQKKDTVDDFLSKLNGTKTIENEILFSLQAVLERPENFADLIRPNDTDIVKPMADEIRGATQDKEGTRMFEVLHNLKIQQASSVGQTTIGIGAINNTFNAVFQAIGLELNPSYELFDQTRRATLLFKHNKNKEGGISLSNRFDALDENNVSDVISQLMNGWVDIEKDDWISYIEGNREIAPIMLFMIRAGVPVRDVVKFVTQPVIKEYVFEQRLAKSSFSRVLGKGRGRTHKRDARNEILAKKFGLVNPSYRDLAFLAEVFTAGITDFGEIDLARGLTIGTGEPVEKLEAFNDAQDFEKRLRKGMNAEVFKTGITALFGKAKSDTEVKLIHRKFSIITHPDKGGKLEFSQILNDLYDRYKAGTLSGGSALEQKNKREKTITNIELGLFLHFLEIEEMTKKVDEVQRAFNVDTNPLQSLTEFYAKVAEIKKLEENTLVPDEFIEELKNNSPIGPFYIHEFALALFGRVLPLRNHSAVNEYLGNLASLDVAQLWDLSNNDERVRFYHVFKNDLIQYVFQRTLRAYKKDAAIKTENREVSGDPFEAFVNKEEYNNYVQYFEKLRALNPIEDVKDTIDFKELLKINENKDREEGETEEAFAKRIEEITYQDWLKEQSLYGIFNPWQLFKNNRNVATKYRFIVEKYPELKESFSLLKNIKISSSGGFTNLMPSTMKFTKDEIDVFHENFKDLANSNVLVTKGFKQEDADYISDFFKKLPIYLYLQAGANTKNAFSFSRILPMNTILRILEKPVGELTKTIDQPFLEEFKNAFIIANLDKSTRNRFKEYLKPDQEEKPTAEEKMQLELFDVSPPKTDLVNHSMSYKMPAKDNLTGVDTTTLELAERGLRTATTRSYPLGKVGDIVTFEGRPQQYRIIEVERLTEKNTTDPDWVKQWSRKEQWTEEYYRLVLNKKNTVKVGSYQTTFEKIEKPSTSKFEKPSTMFEIVNHSGGARGSDSAWDDIGAEYGMTQNRHYYAEGEKTPKGNVPISKAELREADPFVKKANETLKRKFPTSNEYVNNLLRRNYWQVKNSDAVYAIGTITDNMVNGGTGWAVQMAIDMGKQVTVFDQERNNWFYWNGTEFEETGVPMLSKNFAGVGTREINDAGRKAIRDVYAFTEENLDKTLEQSKKTISNEELNEAMNKCKTKGR